MRARVLTIFDVLTHPRDVKEGRRFPPLYNLFLLANGEQSVETKRGKYNRAYLAKRVGSHVANLAREGFKSYWKVWAPPIPQHGLRSSSYYGTYIAMIGLCDCARGCRSTGIVGAPQSAPQSTKLPEI